MPRGPGGVKRPRRRLGSHTRRSVSCRKAHPKVRKAHPQVQEESVGPSAGLRVVGRATRRFAGVSRPTQRSGRGQKARPEVRKWSGGPHEGSEGVGKPTRRSGRGREAHPEVLNGSGSPPGGQRGVGRPTWRSRRPSIRSRRIQEALTEVREAYPKVREGLGGPPGVLGGVGRPIWRSRRG